MKVLLMSQNNNIEKLMSAVTKKGYKGKEVKDIETVVGIKSGIQVEVEDPSQFVLNIGSEFTEDEKTDDIGITFIQE